MLYIHALLYNFISEYQGTRVNALEPTRPENSCFLTTQLESFSKDTTEYGKQKKIYKMEAWGRYGQLESGVSLEEFLELRSTLMKKIRMAKMGQEITLADNIKDNTNTF